MTARHGDNFARHGDNFARHGVMLVKCRFFAPIFYPLVQVVQVVQVKNQLTLSLRYTLNSLCSLHAQGDGLHAWGSGGEDDGTCVAGGTQVHF